MNFWKLYLILIPCQMLKVMAQSTTYNNLMYWNSGIQIIHSQKYQTCLSNKNIIECLMENPWRIISFRYDAAPGAHTCPRGQAVSFWPPFSPSCWLHAQISPSGPLAASDFNTPNFKSSEKTKRAFLSVHSNPRFSTDFLALNSCPSLTVTTIRAGRCPSRPRVLQCLLPSRFNYGERFV